MIPPADNTLVTLPSDTTPTKPKPEIRDPRKTNSNPERKYDT